MTLMGVWAEEPPGDGGVDRVVKRRSLEDVGDCGRRMG